MLKLGVQVEARLELSLYGGRAFRTRSDSNIGIPGNSPSELGDVQTYPKVAQKLIWQTLESCEKALRELRARQKSNDMDHDVKAETGPCAKRAVCARAHRQYS